MANNFSADHAMAFGAITHLYARIEGFLKYIMADMLDTTLVRAWIICDPYGAQNIRNVVKALNQEASPQTEYNERLKHLLGSYKSFSLLRNRIAHFMWADAERPGSIKPIGVDIRNRQAKMIGLDDADDTYTLDELKAEVTKLENLEAEFSKFLLEMGVYERVSAKIEETKSSTN